MRKCNPKDRLVNKLDFVVVYQTPKRRKVGERRVSVKVEPGLFYEQPERCILRAEQHAIETVAKTGNIIIASYSV